ncbi:MAG: transporter, partial [Nevskiales bacterium]
VHGLDRLFNGSLSLAYGAAEDFTLVASLPYVSRQGQREAMHAHPDEHAHGDDAPLPLPEVLPLFGLGAARANHEHADPAHAEAAAVRDLNDASGLGDLIVLGQYRWLHDAAAGRQGAWLFGLKTPTGRTDLRNADGERLEVHHQPGSGSWDILLGAAFTRRWAVGACDANLLYTHTGHGSQDTRLGRGFAYNLGFSRRLASPAAPQEPHTHHHHEHPHAQPETGSVNNTLNWDLMLELNGEWRDRERQTGVSVENTGGHLLYLAPGLRASQGRWSAGLSLGVPVVQDLNGIQSAADYRLLVSLGASLQ